jgi:hypothetical protein
MKRFLTEKFVENFGGCEVYPITIVKFLLNRGKIQNFFTRAADKDFEIRVKYKIDHSDCPQCKEKESSGVLCRQHTSIQRVLEAKHVLFDLDTQTYFIKNEIYRMVGGRLVIVYCPHPKLIKDEITDEKVRKINPITIEDSSLTSLPKYDKVSDFLSSALMEQYMSCWFNDNFSLVTIPRDRRAQDWCLVPNPKDRREVKND